MNLYKYDTLNQEIQVTPEYGYIYQQWYHSAKWQLPSQCQAPITKQVCDPVTEPPNTMLMK